jgi:hypothetical protein
MITLGCGGKPVIVVGMCKNGAAAIVHYVEALGRCEVVPVENLCATTLGELEEALLTAPVLPAHACS